MARRLHFYAGLLVGPFILVAALSGAAYAVAPAVEAVVYQEELSAPGHTEGGDPRPLSEQVAAAAAVVPEEQGYALSAVRPAAEAGTTTRVMYSHPDLGASESRAVFVDPGTLEIRGDATVYGTSGSLPLRTAVSNFHRHLGLGEAGRLYSETAASWLWIVSLGGLVLWAVRRAALSPKSRRRKSRPQKARPQESLSQESRPARDRSAEDRPARDGGAARWHRSIGLWALAGALFLSATGLTWSAHAGANVTEVRSALGWTTPSVATELPAPAGNPADGGQTSGGEASEGRASALGAPSADGATIDGVWSAARAVNIDPVQAEIVPGADAASAWTVTEIQRSFPTQVDSVAIDPSTLAVVDRVDFADYPLAAKLARWGVDVHMGTLFGVVNQVLLALLGVSLAALVVLGYRQWWLRGSHGFGRAPRAGALVRAPWWAVVVLFGAAIAVGVFLPLFGLPLAAFVVVDAVAAAFSGRRSPA